MAAMVKWADLPTVTIIEILKNLNSKDRLKASTVCKQWRSCLFHKDLWSNRTLVVKIGRTKKSRQIAQLIGRYLSRLTIEFEAQNLAAVLCTLKILEIVSRSTNLKCLTFKPTSCHISLPSTRYQIIHELIERLMEITLNTRKLQHLSLGCITEFCEKSAEIVFNLGQHHANTLYSLHVASVRENPQISNVGQPLSGLCTLKMLQILSIDYDQLSNEILKSLSSNPVTLKQLNLHVHNVDFDKRLISKESWRILVSKCKNLQVNCSVLHSENAASRLKDIIPAFVPLVTLRLLFNCYLTPSLLNYIGNYSSTLKYLDIIDGIDETPRIYCETQYGVPDPLIMLAYLCTNLRRLTIIGYLILDEYIVGISRLRRKTLKSFSVPQCCIGVAGEAMDHNIFHVKPYDENFNSEISYTLKADWSPLQDYELHPSVIDPMADAETAYLHLLLSDQKMSL